MKVGRRGRRGKPSLGKADSTGDLPAAPTIALSAHWHTYPERFEWIMRHGFALEYSPNPEAFDLLPTHLARILEAGIPVRHHGFFPQYELGHGDPGLAEDALRLHQAALEALCGRGEQVLTVHIGLDRQLPLDGPRAVANLARLVDHARTLDITVALENLRYGPTSDPETVLAWARESGAMITLDVGHAVSCSRVARGELDPLDFVEVFADRLIEAHVYEREASRHYPPQDMAVLGPIIDALLATQCGWWTIELNDLDEALATRSLLLDYIASKQDERWSCANCPSAAPLASG
jgi:sugar phosphate isomerase/epimerase